MKSVGPIHSHLIDECNMMEIYRTKALHLQIPTPDSAFLLNNMKHACKCDKSQQKLYLMSTYM